MTIDLSTPVLTRLPRLLTEVRRLFAGRGSRFGSGFVATSWCLSGTQNTRRACCAGYCTSSTRTRCWRLLACNHRRSRLAVVQIFAKVFKSSNLFGFAGRSARHRRGSGAACWAFTPVALNAGLFTGRGAMCRLGLRLARSQDITKKFLLGFILIAQFTVVGMYRCSREVGEGAWKKKEKELKFEKETGFWGEMGRKLSLTLIFPWMLARVQFSLLLSVASGIRDGWRQSPRCSQRNRGGLATQQPPGADFREALPN